MLVSVDVISGTGEAILMFSREDLRSFSLSFEFPAQKEESLAEWIMKNVPLSMLKLAETDFLGLSTRIFGGVPLITGYSETGINFSVSRSSIDLSLGVEASPIALRKEQKKEEAIAKLFDEKNLNGLSNDLNFLIGRVLGRFQENKGLVMDFSGDLEVVSEEPDFDLSHNFNEGIISALSEIGAVHFSGLSFELENQSKINEIECELSDQEVSMTAYFDLSYKQPINISGLVEELLDEINDLYQKLKGD